MADRKPGSGRLAKRDSDKILQVLSELYPESKTELYFETPFQLLVATMLSAQSTDRQVNIITQELFSKFREPEAFVRLTPVELEEHIKSCGLYKNKAKNIIATSRILVEQYSSEVPDRFEDLVKLPGVGRKTANVVLANAFGQDTIAVDTHVFRVANRLGLSDAVTPEKTEEDLRRIIPAGRRNEAHHWLIYHGRRICRARKPGCDECPLSPYCRHFLTLSPLGEEAARVLRAPQT